MKEEQTDSFAFVHAGRTFTCCVERSPASARGAWWWFAVSTEDHARHAPFRAAETDTREDVSARIVEYYDALLARRAAPYQSRWQARSAQKPPASAGEEAPAG